jgi:epoxyqueuosine reductase
MVNEDLARNNFAEVNMSLTGKIKDFALDLGYHAVGVCPAHPFYEFSRCMEDRKEEYASLSYLRPWDDPHNVHSEAKSIVSAVFDYFTEGFPQELVGKIGRIYQARCYLAPPDRIHGARVRLMREFMEAKGCRVAPWPTGRSGVPDRRTAARAGVAQFGRNNFACAPRVGSFIMVHSFVVDIELEYDLPTEEAHCPPDCRLCLEACPTGALVEDFKLDPRRCIAYNNFFTRGEETGVSTFIPREIREKMGCWIHGCDVCQEVCPRNQVKLKAKKPANAFLEKKAGEFHLVDLLNLTDDYYTRVVQPLMYNYIRDLSLFRRNAAIALGNLGDTDTVPALTEALRDPAEVVRAHVAWALGRIGGRAARRALEDHRPREQGKRAGQEVRDALAMLG